MPEIDEFGEDLEGEAGIPPAFRVPDEEGQVRISDEVVSNIAAIAAGNVDGVAGMSSGLVGGLSEMLGKRNLARGVRVEVGERSTAIDLYLIVDYGVRIPTVAQRVQEKVKQVVESMTGLKVAAVNIHVQGVSFPQEERVSG